MSIDSTGLGIDMEENQRFVGKSIENDSAFLNKIFSKTELDYCFSKTDPSQHLCARFAAKEAALKALGLLDLKANYAQIEVVNNELGAPLLNINKALNVMGIVSLSHTKTHSVAIVIIEKNNA